jgi:hypothetical protein
MFAFINTNAPFRTLKLIGNSVLGLLSLRRHARMLAFATKVHWSSGGSLWHRRSTRPWTVTGQSIRFVLSVLQTSTSLRTLRLSGVEVKPPHQLVILSIPTLKKLILDRSYFVPTPIEVPLSSITALSFVGGAFKGHCASLEHALGLLKNTLETLEVGYVPKNIFPILEAVQLPHLTSLYVTASGFNVTPRAFSSITKLWITVLPGPRPLSLSDGLFPQLRELFSPWWIGDQLIPRRPVEVFHGIGMKGLELDRLQGSLALLSQSTRGIKELQLYMPHSIPRLLHLLATNIPQLQRLHLSTRPECVVAEWIASQQTPIEGNLNALTEVHIRFIGTLYYIDWCHIQQPALRILSAVRSWICPALEVAEIFVVKPMLGSIARIVFPSLKYKFRRIQTGEWEEQM